uniref:PBZ-type domain-containing protein n=1 Tax=Timema genevievae TaxID=629358 RepID=A0A7R9K5C9_TIMGE|nr:unnamed protein product [Timema genevievae]
MESNEKDKRIPCKYGSKCYQKNELHHKKYNHPPKRQLELLDDVKKPVKKHKLVAKVSVKKNMTPGKNECSTSSENNTEAPPTKIKTPPKLNKTASDEPVKQTIAQETCTLGNEGSSEGPVTSKEKGDKSSEDGEDNIPSSPEDVRESIKQKFLLEMPEDFYSFWSFCENISKDKPSEAFKDVGLYLVGPFDVLSGDLKKVKNRRLSSYLRHWRYYYDPPEFQTIVRGDEKQLFHMGYYRDDPQSPPCFVASNCAAVSCIIVPVAENLFGAINSYLESKKKTCGPFILMKVSRLQNALQSWAKRNNFTLDVSTSQMKARERKVVAKTFHKAGIVVPVDKKSDLGYREMLEDDASLKRLLKRVADSTSDAERTSCLSNLQPVLTAASIATDECDFGTGLELGIDLFSYGGDVFHNTIVQYLNTAYTLLQRQEFSKIIQVLHAISHLDLCLPQAHLKLRKKGCNLSMLDEDSR